MSRPSEILPPGWSECTLGDFCDIVQGQSPPSSSYSESETQGMPFLQGNAEFGSRVPIPRKRTTEPRKVANEGSVLLSVRAPVGDTNLSPGVVAIGRGLSSVTPLGGISREFVLWLLRSKRQELEVQATGTTFSAVTGRVVRALVVRLPPLAEQEAIVERLAALWDRIESGVTQLRLAREGASTFRAAVLRDALAGEWERVPLRDTLLSLRNGIFVSRPLAEPPGIPIYRISAVRPLALKEDDVRYAPRELDKHETYLVQADDLLFTRYSGNPEYVGACAKVPENATPALHPDKLIRGVVDKNVADPGFLELACAGGTTWEEIRARRKTTAGQVGISGKQLASVTVPLPPLELQRKIAETCHRQLQAARDLEADLQRSVAQAEKLREVVLHTAVTGKLVPAPLFAESAAVLLGRVTEERSRARAHGKKPPGGS